jgi:hypothetical protein
MLSSHRLLACLLSLVCAGTALLGQGSLTPTAAPAPTQKSLQELWDKVAALEAQNLAAQKRLLATQQQLAVLIENSDVWLPWRITNVDKFPSSGWLPIGDTSLAFSPAGMPAISYYEAIHGDLKFAQFNGSSWATTTVDSYSYGFVREFHSLALAFSPAGQPAISYYDAINKDLKFAQFNGSKWAITTVDSNGDVGQYTSLAFSPSGQPAISYYDSTNGDLKFAQFNGSTWAITTVDNAGNVGQKASLAFSPAGQPAIAYVDPTNGNLKCAQFNGSAWAITTVGTTTGSQVGSPSLAFSPAGQPAIGYFDPTNRYVMLARFNGLAWDITPVTSSDGDGTYCFTSLAFSPTGQPAISYCHSGSGHFFCDLFNGSSWESDLVDRNDSSFYFNSLAFSPAGQPAISYYDQTSSTLKFATRAPFAKP